MTEGNGDLTRDILRAELRAGLAEQTIGINRRMDERFKPVNDHIARVDRGELTDAQKGAILAVVESSQERVLTKRSLKMPLYALLISGASLIATVFMTLIVGGAFHA